MASVGTSVFLGAIMANTYFSDFDDRTRRIERAHRKLARGYVTTITRDGVIIHRPRRRYGPSLRGLSVTFAALLGFKVLLYTYLGAIAYGGRIAELAGGTAIESVGAWMMQAGPMTVWTSQAVRELIALFV